MRQSDKLIEIDQKFGSADHEFCSAGYVYAGGLRE
jgi:hypothetical protein